MSSHVLVYCACINLVHCPQKRSFELAIYIFFNTNRGQMYRSLEGQSINCSLSPCYEASETKIHCSCVKSIATGHWIWRMFLFHFDLKLIFIPKGVTSGRCPFIGVGEAAVWAEASTISEVTAARKPEYKAVSFHIECFYQELCL